MRDCEKYREWIPLLSGGELEEGERVSLIAHVTECPDCAEEVGRYRELRAALTGLREVDPPPGTYEAMWDGVRRSLFGRRLRGLFWRMAALVVIGLSVGLVVGGMEKADVAGEPPPDAAVVEELMPSSRAGGVTRVISDGSPERRRIRSSVFSGSSLNANHYLPGVRAIYPGDEVDF